MFQQLHATSQCSQWHHQRSFARFSPFAAHQPGRARARGVGVARTVYRRWLCYAGTGTVPANPRMEEHHPRTRGPALIDGRSQRAGEDRVVGHPVAGVVLD